MTLIETIDYIEREWPDIYDANSVARWAIKRTCNDGLYADLAVVDQVCGYWVRHQHD